MQLRSLTVVFAGLASTLVACNAVAAIQSKETRWKRVWRASNLPLEIPVGTDPQNLTLNLPAQPHADGTVLALRLTVRIHTASPSGWGDYTGITVNGTPIGESKSAGSRLLNRSAIFEMAGASDYPTHAFQSRDGRPALQTFFTPDSNEIDRRITGDRDQGSTYVLDVDDLVKKDAPNTIVITNLAIQRLFGKTLPAGLRMVVEQLELGEIPQSEASALSRGPVYKRQPAKNGASVSDGDVTLTVTPAGALQLDIKNETYFVESALSYSSDGGLQYNRLSAGNRSSGEPGWLPRVSKVDPKTLRVETQGHDYSLVRTVSLKSGVVRISDEISNRSNTATGLVIRHDIVSGERPVCWRIGGLEKDDVPTRVWAENPTAYLEQANSSLAARIDDSVLRLQFGAERRGNVISVSFNHFGLAQGASRALNWTLFTGSLQTQRSPSTGFYKFINAARRDWNVNFTIQGPFEFVDAERIVGPDGDAYLTELVDRKGVKLFGLIPWFEYYSSADMTRDEYRTLMQKARQAIRKKQPDAKCLGLVESNLTRFPLSFFGGDVPSDIPYGHPGNRFPIGKAPGKYPLTAPPAMAKRLDASPWRDSLERDPAGQILIDTYYVQHYAGKALNLVVYPMPGNYWNAQMLDRIKFLLDDAGMDGIYFDQFSFAYELRDRYVPEPWDGYTVDLDANGRITRRYGDLGLLTSTARQEWVRQVLSRGKIAVANSNPAVTEEQSLHVFRYMETQGYNPMVSGPPDAQMCAKGQLGSPIGLGTGEAKAFGAAYFNRTVAAQLRYSLLYYYYYISFPSTGEKGGEFGIVPKMFPLTPVELGEGYLVGKERIVTTVSRVFDRPDGAKPRVELFDENGRTIPVNDAIKLQHTPEGWRVTVQLVDWRQFAVID